MSEITYSIVKQEEEYKLDKHKIYGHKGTWYEIYRAMVGKEGEEKTEYILLENEVYGDEVPCLIVEASCPYTVVLEDVYRGFDDLVEYLEGEEEDL